ncbi:hypothetical protein [Desmospora profundinema]|uniref:DUF4386 family protein n=1 Tax=Desmospora profundinema TaxID=1571184 RepID=A0ABU1IQ25_9BACL|nr:hypothetical protein [Desmospora profundinema]MDR6226838.1 hypothetical protein [Desmospora profundinema]
MDVKKLSRRLILLGAPAALGLLGVWHPAHVYFDEMISSPGQGDWWLLLHTLQMPLFPLIATAMWLLLKNSDGITASLSRVALWIFAITYTAFDTIAGIATGILFRHVRGLNVSDGDEVYDRMFDLFLALFNLDMPGGTVIMNVAVWSWVAAAILAAAALYMKGYNRVGVILIGLSALTFQSHVHPYGPITMALLLAGIICIEFFPYKWTEVKRPETGGDLS